MNFIDGVASTRERVLSHGLTEDREAAHDAACDMGFNLKQAIFECVGKMPSVPGEKDPIWMFGEFPHLVRRSMDIVPLLNDTLRFAKKRCVNGAFTTIRIHANVRQSMVVLDIEELPDPFQKGNCLVSVALGRVFE